MPTDPFLPEGRQFPRTRSPDAGDRDRKRRRKVLSCYDCRRRKLQCDRALPACGRCTKAGQAANCLYLEDATDAPIREEPLITPGAHKLAPFYGHSTRPIGATAPSGDLLSRLEYQDGRIKQLEVALVKAAGAPGGKVPPTPESLAGGGALENLVPVQDRETTLLRGKAFKTQFHGNTHPGALIARIPELTGFTRDTFEQFPALSKIKEDMGSLETRIDYAGSKHGSLTDEALKLMLPTQTEADQLIETYLDNYGNLYNVLHLPSFRTEYQAMWEEGVQSAKPHFVALLLCMMAAAQCLTSKSPWLYRANSSTAREKAVNWISAVDDWLVSQSQKHVAAIDFQLRVVLLVAKNVTARKFKRTWTECGNVLRFCMAAGLHRTPELIRKPTSILDKELRKRVWAAIAELELQASFDRGMVSAPWSLQSDCPGPVHVHDDDIDQETQHLPALRKFNDFTPTSYLCLASDSHQLRATLNTYLNNIRQPISFEETKRYTDEIEYHLQNIPDWPNASDAALVPKAMLDINLRQYMLVLHDRQIRTAETKAERDFSRMILIETATKMVQAHKSLTSRSCFALELLCYDQLRAGMSLCHISATNPHADDALGHAIDEAAFKLVPECCDMLTDKVIRFGREQRQLWILLAASGYMKSKKDPSKKMLYMQEAVEKVTRPYYKIMACQEDAPAQPSVPKGAATTQVVPPTAAAAASSSSQQQQAGADGKAGGQSSDVQYYPDPATGQVGAGASMTDPTAMLDLDELAAWTFEDWSFNPADIMSMTGHFGATPGGNGVGFGGVTPSSGYGGTQYPDRTT
ncbi:hypothetical protein Slin15195_G049910 [Septoria linicola]|uniref:Zn(2)-C6 fungal-type domain-containing protein n=1 Tax=Septoria linicola TaxID=215465 RepID=A0A9Q9ATE8_9PEZI|nr:hypothetical protein Slin14017_G053430 [Septoria linicola]USW51672.1 hypothetical protein Slin15195_G049910 [Septoria linicola]